MRKIISCSSRQIPRMLWECYRTALLIRKVVYHTQQCHTFDPSHPLYLSGTMTHFTVAAAVCQPFQRGCHITSVMKDLLPNLIF